MLTSFDHTNIKNVIIFFVYLTPIPSPNQSLNNCQVQGMTSSTLLRKQLPAFVDDREMNPFSDAAMYGGMLLIYSPPSTMTGVSSRPCFFLFKLFKSISANYLINEDSYKNASRPRHSQGHKASLCQRDSDFIKQFWSLVVTYTHTGRVLYNRR